MQHPDREKGSGVCGTEPLENPTTDGIIEEQATQRKRFASAQARAAHIGHELRQVQSGFVLSRWTHSKHVADLDSVLALLSQMDGRKSEVQP